MAPLTEEDRILIRAEKGYNAHQMMIEFLSRKWNKYALHRLIKQIDATGTSNSRNYGRKRSARTAANIAQVQELICSQDNNPVIKARGGHIEYSLKIVIVSTK